MVSTLSENGVQNGSDFLKLELEIASVEGVCIIITCPEAAKLHMSHMTRVINVYFFFGGGASSLESRDRVCIGIHYHIMPSIVRTGPTLDSHIKTSCLVFYIT